LGDTIGLAIIILIFKVMKRINFIYLIFILSYFKSIGQTDNVNAIITRTISPSPTATALGRYQDVPVNECTGIPSISIPLFEVKANGYSLPVSLSYYAGGIKVEELSSWVGLGWSLNAGGVITRTVHGKPDESGYTGNDGSLIPANGNVSPFTHDGFVLLKNCATNVYDLQPDEYIFNFAGYSGRFVISPDGNTHLMPASSIKIVRDNYARKPRFTATTPDGMIYTFAGTEVTEPTDNGDYGTPIGAYVSTWYLTSVEFPDSKQTITLEYSDYTNGYLKNYFYNERWEVLPPTGAGLIAPSTINASVKVYGLHLSKINFPTGSVQFIPKNETRQDLPGDQILEYVKVFDNNSLPVKTYKLEYTYYNSSNPDPNFKRLRLERIQEQGLSGGVIPPYVFTYNNEPLPAINSFSQDHWGFYNRKPNSKLIPAGMIGEVIIPGADRNIDANFTKAGILEKISYPTGGTTTFEFEGNTQYADEKVLVDAGQSASCNSGPTTNEPTSCTSESTPFKFTNAVGNITVSVDRQLLAGNTANAFLVNISTGGSIPLHEGPPYLLTGIDGTSTYKIRTETFHEGGDQNEFIWAVIQWKEYDNNSLIKSKPAPGLRIKKITSSDGVDPEATKVTSYEYDMFNDVGRSSGFMTGSVPTYEYSFSVLPVGTSPEKVYVLRFSKSQSDLGGSDCVLYRNVKKIVGNSTTNGYVNSYYGIDNSNMYCSNDLFPFTPCTNLNYKSQLLTRQVIYSNVGKMVKDDSYSYFFDPTNNYMKTPGMAAGYIKRNYNDYGGTSLDFSTNIFNYNKYDYISEWYYLKTLTSKLYDQNGLNPSTVVTDYGYNNPAHMQLTSTTTKNSQGDQIIVGQKYPLDYAYSGALTGSALVMQEMVNRHIFSSPIEVFNFKIINNSNPNVWIIPYTGGILNTYKISNGQVVKAITYSLKISTTTTDVPLSDPTNFVASSITNGQFQYDSRYEVLNSYDLYDLTNNLIQLTDRKRTYGLIREPSTGDVWAQSTRGNYSDIAYTSFEHSDGSNFTNWIYNPAAITATFGGQSGTRAFNLSENQITSIQTLKTVQKYKVSFWKKVGGTVVNVVAGAQAVNMIPGATRNGWQFFEGNFNNATTVKLTGNAIIDELRLCPIEDRMTSFVIKQGVGLTSKCNENNQTTFWEYDEFNRLRITRDQDKYITNKNEYYYQQVQ
jgi:hypothetical protein